MPQSSLGINRNVPKDFSGLSTPLEVGRWPLMLPQIQAQQMERVQQVLQNETRWVLIHRDLALQSRIIPAPGCSVPISACSCSMTPLPSALMEQHIPATPLPGALSVWGSVSLTSPHVPLCSHPAAGRVLPSQESPCQGPAGLDLAPVLLLGEARGQPAAQPCHSLEANRTWEPGM